MTMLPWNVCDSGAWSGTCEEVGIVGVLIGDYLFIRCIQRQPTPGTASDSRRLPTPSRRWPKLAAELPAPRGKVGASKRKAES
jgi:hypothetical protein